MDDQLTRANGFDEAIIRVEQARELLRMIVRDGESTKGFDMGHEKAIGLLFLTLELIERADKGLKACLKEAPKAAA